jgi:hypothetical protein
VNKNWPSGLTISCNLVELTETNVELEEKLEEFEGTFERDEILQI